MIAMYTDAELKEIGDVELFLKTSMYKNVSTTVSKTKAVQRDIGTRKKPLPNGKPGYIRVNTVHQGDKDKEKGVYHINLVDEVTQWDIMVAVEGISEEFLIEAIEGAIEDFPFKIIAFHSFFRISSFDFFYTLDTFFITPARKNYRKSSLLVFRTFSSLKLST